MSDAGKTVDHKAAPGKCAGAVAGGKTGDHEAAPCKCACASAGAGAVAADGVGSHVSGRSPACGKAGPVAAAAKPPAIKLIAQVASTGRATCDRCREVIVKGELRVAAVRPTTRRGERGDEVTWYHARHAVLVRDVRAHLRSELADDAFLLFEGVDALPGSARVELDAAIQSAHA